MHARVTLVATAFAAFVAAAAAWLLFGASPLIAAIQGIISAATIATLFRVSTRGANLRGSLVFVGVWLFVVLIPVSIAIYDPVNGWIYAAFGAIDYAGATQLGLALGSAGLALGVLSRIRRGRTSAVGPLTWIWLAAGLVALVSAFLALAVASELVIDETTIPVLFNTLWAALGGAAGWLTGQAIRTHRVTAVGAMHGITAGVITALPSLPWLAPAAAVVIAIIAGILGPVIFAGSLRAHFGTWSVLVSVCLVPGVLGMVLAGVVANGIGFMYSGQLALTISQLEGTVLIVCYATIVTAIIALVVDRALGLFTQRTRAQ